MPAPNDYAMPPGLQPGGNPTLSQSQDVPHYRLYYDQGKLIAEQWQASDNTWRNATLLKPTDIQDYISSNPGQWEIWQGGQRVSATQVAPPQQGRGAHAQDMMPGPGTSDFLDQVATVLGPVIAAGSDPAAPAPNTGPPPNLFNIPGAGAIGPSPEELSHLAALANLESVQATEEPKRTAIEAENAATQADYKRFQEGPAFQFEQTKEADAQARARADLVQRVLDSMTGEAARDVDSRRSANVSMFREAAPFAVSPEIASAIGRMLPGLAGGNAPATTPINIDTGIINTPFDPAAAVQQYGPTAQNLVAGLGINNPAPISGMAYGGRATGYPGIFSTADGGYVRAQGGTTTTDAMTQLNVLLGLDQLYKAGQITDDAMRAMEATGYIPPDLANAAIAGVTGKPGTFTSPIPTVSEQDLQQRIAAQQASNKIEQGRLGVEQQNAMTEAARAKAEAAYQQGELGIRGKEAASTAAYQTGELGVRTKEQADTAAYHQGLLTDSHEQLAWDKEKFAQDLNARKVEALSKIQADPRRIFETLYYQAGMKPTAQATNLQNTVSNLQMDAINQGVAPGSPFGAAAATPPTGLSANPAVPNPAIPGALPNTVGKMAKGGKVGPTAMPRMHIPLSEFRRPGMPKGSGGRTPRNSFPRDTGFTPKLAAGGIISHDAGASATPARQTSDSSPPLIKFKRKDLPAGEYYGHDHGHELEGEHGHEHAHSHPHPHPHSGHMPGGGTHDHLHAHPRHVHPAMSQQELEKMVANSPKPRVGHSAAEGLMILPAYRMAGGGSVGKAKIKLSGSLAVKAFNLLTGDDDEGKPWKAAKGMGFKAAQASIAKREGISADRAGAILAASTRNASPAAKRANPNLRRVKGSYGVAATQPTGNLVAATGKSVPGPALVLVGEGKDMSGLRRGTAEAILAAPGTVVAPLPPGKGVTKKQMVDAILNQMAKTGSPRMAGGGNISPGKAREMLRNPPGGRPLSDKQRGLFGLIAGGGKPKRAFGGLGGGGGPTGLSSPAPGNVPSPMPAGPWGGGAVRTGPAPASYYTGFSRTPNPGATPGTAPTMGRLAPGMTWDARSNSIVPISSLPGLSPAGVTPAGSHFVALRYGVPGAAPPANTAALANPFRTMPQPAGPVSKAPYVAGGPVTLGAQPPAGAVGAAPAPNTATLANPFPTAQPTYDPVTPENLQRAQMDALRVAAGMPPIYNVNLPPQYGGSGADMGVLGSLQYGRLAQGMLRGQAGLPGAAEGVDVAAGGGWFGTGLTDPAAGFYSPQPNPAATTRQSPPPPTPAAVGANSQTTGNNPSAPASAPNPNVNPNQNTPSTVGMGPLTGQATGVALPPIFNQMQTTSLYNPFGGAQAMGSNIQDYFNKSFGGMPTIDQLNRLSPTEGATLDATLSANGIDPQDFRQSAQSQFQGFNPFPFFRSPFYVPRAQGFYD